MIRRVLPLLLVLLIPVVTAVAQDTTPNWPEWVFGSGWPNNPSWPPGDYPVIYQSGGIGPDTPGILHHDGGPLGDFYEAHCVDAACTEIQITYLTYPGGAQGEMPTPNWIRIRWSDWVHVPPGTATPPTTLTPGTTTPPPSTVTPPPPTPTPRVDCPADVIQQQPPRAEMLSKTPQNPVVRGQGGMGLIITYRATSYPVVRHYWVEVDNSHWGCVHESGFEDDGRYGVSPCNEGWEGWETQWITDISCEEKIEIIPDPIVATSFAGHARLRENSKRWIEGELRQRYPGAQVKRPNWDVRGRVVRQGCYDDGRCILEAQVYFPFEDPGWYDVWADGRTAGTAYTPPRSFRYQPPEPQPVYLMDSTLIPDW